MFHLLPLIIASLLFVVPLNTGAQLAMNPSSLHTGYAQGTTSNGVLMLVSIGQPFYATLAGNNLALTQGFNQPKTSTCPGDFDGNGLINITDLLLFNAGFGTQNNAIDLNNDGLVGITDLIIFITLIGLECPN